MGDDIQRRYVERDRNAAYATGRRHHPLVAHSLKTALAAGVAFALGNLLPEPLDQYAYFAPLGAVTVMYPAVADSVWQAAKAAVAVLLGVALAAVTMVIVRPDALSVAAVVGIGTAIGGLGWFGEQRSWLPLAALFVLTASEPNTEVYVVGYLTALPLGAAVGIGANVLIFPSMSLYNLHHAVRDLRLAVITQLQQMSQVLRHGEDGLDTQRWHESLTDLTEPREHLRAVWTTAARARRGNIRSRRWSGVQHDLLELAGALQRCSLLVEDVSIMLTEFESSTHPLLGTNLQTMTADTLDALGDVLQHPEETAPNTERTRTAQRSIEQLLDRVGESRFEDRHSRLMAGAVAVCASRSLLSFARRHGVEDDENAEPLRHADLGDSRIVIEQAKGILAASAGVDMDHAFAALRARADRTGTHVTQVATDLTTGKVDPTAVLADSDTSAAPENQ